MVGAGVLPEAQGTHFGLDALANRPDERVGGGDGANIAQEFEDFGLPSGDPIFDFDL